MTMTFDLVVGRVAWNHKPANNGEVAECQRREHYKVRNDATASLFFEWVCEGRCWRAGTLKEGAINFKKTSFCGSRVFALDFDSSDKTPEEIVEYAKSLQLEPNFFYYSFSQGKKPGYNFRIVWVLDKLITIEEYEALYKAIQQDEVFSHADKATKDVSRLWFGTNNGGKLLRDEAIAFERFNIFAREISRTAKGEMRQKSLFDAGEIEEDDYIIPFIEEESKGEMIYLPWYEYLKGKCDLWDRWVSGKYLHYSQRLLLFTELKKLKYPDSSNRFIISDVMKYYDAELYRGSKCDEREIRYFLANRNSKANNPIVNGRWTIAEFFRTKAYETFKKKKKKRISRDELQARADKVILDALKSSGIDYVECQTEAGKTKRIIDYFKDIDFTQKKIIYAVPRYNILDEFITRAEKAGISSDVMCYPRKVDYSAEDLYYLNAGFPEGIEITEQMLARKEELRKVRDKDAKGLFLITHVCLSHLQGLHADEVIIDENIEDCLIYKVNIPLTTLSIMSVYLNDEDAERELQSFISRAKNSDDNTTIEKPDFELIFKHFDFRSFVENKKIEDTGKKDVGLLKRAENITVNREWGGNQYIHFEIVSSLIPEAIETQMPIKLFTGTSKIEQLKVGYGEEIAKHINYTEVERAEPQGKVIQYSAYSGSKAKIGDALRGAIKLLERDNVEWQSIPLLTLKSAVPLARELGYKIPQQISREGVAEDLYIENCSGIDSLNGQDLIVIGKSDLPKNAYVDMVHNEDIPTTMSTSIRIVPDTGSIAMIHGFVNEKLWGLQLEGIRQQIEQAVGRGRNLWHDNTVYVFCDFPVRSATTYRR